VDLIGAEESAAGLLMAAEPAGAAVGALLLTRLVSPETRSRLLGPLTVLTGVPLGAMAFAPPVAVSPVLLLASGLFAAYQTVANALFVRTVPDELRGQAVGIVASGLFAAQGLGISASGLFAEIAGPAAAIATFAVIGVLAAIPAGIAWRQAARPSRTREKGGVIMTRGKPIEWH